jgi:inactivated superfamily I helicase
MHNENERRIDHLVDLVDKQTRTERHLEQHSDISDADNINHAKNIQEKRQEEIENLKNIIVNGEHSNNDQKENLRKRYEYTEGYLNHNADHMDQVTLENTKEKQEHRKEQMNNYK